MEIAIIDDQSTSRLVISRLVHDLQDGLLIREYGSAREALAAFTQRSPDLVIVDFKMPGLTGMDLIATLRADAAYDDVPIVMITSSEDEAVRRQALEQGASDFLRRPVDHAECRARVRNLLRLRRQTLLLKDRAKLLEAQVAERVKEIQARDWDTIMRLAKAGEYRDEETGNHVLRMSRYSTLIAERLGLSPEECQRIEIAAPMHDIGKIGIPDAVLLKPGRHTREEQEIMHRHTVIGHEILQASPSAYLQLGAVIALGHHERWDGSGYPRGLIGEANPLEARVVAVADVFDALVSTRPYKQPWSVPEAVQYLKQGSGTHFDPACVAAFTGRLPDIVDVLERYRDAAGPLR